MYKIAVMGDRDSIFGFRALGIEIFPVNSAEESKKTLHMLAKDNYAVIYVVEQTAAAISADIREYNDSRTPAIIPIPGNQGSMGIGISGIRKSVERAVGADILFGKD